MGFSVWTVPGEARGEHAQQGGELCGGQASGTVRRQRFLPVRVWLVVGFGITIIRGQEVRGRCSLCLGQVLLS